MRYGKQLDKSGCD